MRKTVSNVLGSEYKVAIESEINKLKQSDQKLLGNLVAVVKRSDRHLGRPVEDCGAETEATFAIFEPTREGIVCHEDIGAIKCEGGEYKLISLNYFVDQVLEFNFTYTQLLFAGEIVYENNTFKQLREICNNMVCFDSHRYRSLALNKLVSTAYGIKTDILKGKFKEEEQLKNRVFLVYKIYKILDTYFKTGTFIVGKENFDLYEYSDIVNDLKYHDILKEFDYFTNRIINEYGEIKPWDKKEIKGITKFNLMYPIISRVLDTE